MICSSNSLEFLNLLFNNFPNNLFSIAQYHKIIIYYPLRHATLLYSPSHLTDRKALFIPLAIVDEPCNFSEKNNNKNCVEPDME